MFFGEDMNHGKIIVLEGLDGSGKSTQSQLLLNKFCSLNRLAKIISMPNYSSLSSGPVRMYLNREISDNPFDVNSYASSSFFAVDRFINYVCNWKKFYDSENFTIICDRYSSSNMIFQLAKIDRNNWDSFLDWVCDYEYNKLEIPNPDIVIYLRVPLNISQKLIKLRGTPADLHESSLEFIKSCYEAAEYSAEKFGWSIVNCSENGKSMDSMEVISSKIESILKMEKYI